MCPRLFGHFDRRMIMKRSRKGFYYCIPALAVICFVFVYPLLYTIVLGFFNKTLLRPQMTFAGLSQYAKLFSDDVFLKSIKNTLVWTFFSVIFQFGIGFAFAMLLHQSFVRGKTVLRILLMVPWVLPSIIGSSVWKWMYNADYGIINYLLAALHIIPGYKTWLSRPETAMACVIVVNVWKMFPLVLLMVEAALQGVSKDLKEAATLDGAKPVTVFRVVTWPAICSTCYSLILLLIIWTLNAFTFVYNLTQGGPAHETEVLAMFIHNKAFTEFNFGSASAASTVLFVITVIVSLVYFRFTKSKEEA